MPSQRVPFRKLAEFLSDENMTIASERIGMTRRTYQQAIKHDKQITVWQADKFACRIGVHPVRIWGREWLPD